MLILIASIILIISIFAIIQFMSELKKVLPTKRDLTTLEENKLVDYFDKNIINYIMMTNCYYKISTKKNIYSKDNVFFK